MSGLFRGPSTQQTYYSGIQLQSTSAAMPVPIVWGQNLLTPNCIDYRNFHSGPAPGTKGGKGGIGSLFAGQQETIYYADLIMAVCEGPIESISQVYQTSFSPITLADAELDLVVGNPGQAPTAYWTDTYPAEAIGYSGVGYVWGVNFNLGPSATLGTTSLVVDGLQYGTSYNGVDADPALVINDFLTSTQFGVGFTAPIAGLTGTSGDSSLQSYCQAVGFGISPVLKDLEPANSILARWLQLINCTCVWSSGVLTFIPRGDQTVTGGGGWTFTPDLTVQYALDDDSYCPPKGKTESDPVLIIRSDPYEQDNYVSVEICGRDVAFNTGPIPAFDQQAMDKYGLRVGDTISAHEICSPLVGQTAAQLILQRGIYIRRTFKFSLSWEYCLLDPMDFVSISDSRIGLNATVVRIQSIEEDADGILSVVAEEFPVGVATATPYAIQEATSGVPNGGATPPSVNTPIIWEPPSTLSQGTAQVWAAVSPITADPDEYGGSIVNVSFDGNTYAAVDTFYGVSAQGVLLANIASYSSTLNNPDTINTLAVNLTESQGALASTSLVHAAAGVTACKVDSEYIGYMTATLTAPNEYNLTTLFRGLFGSPVASHSAGAPFVLLSSPLVKYTLPLSEIGQGLWLKFQTFNAAGAQLQSLASCTPYPLTGTPAGQVGFIAGAGVIGPGTSFATAWASTPGTDPAIGNGTLSAVWSELPYSYSQFSINVVISITIGSTTTFGDAPYPITAMTGSANPYSVTATSYPPPGSSGVLIAFSGLTMSTGPFTGFALTTSLTNQFDIEATGLGTWVSGGEINPYWTLITPSALAAPPGNVTGSYTIVNGATTIAQGTVSVSAGTRGIYLYDETLGLVGPTTYSIPAGAVIKISLTWLTTA